MISGVEMPEGMKEYDAFPEPIITPTTKASEGHDEDISREEILSSSALMVSEEAANFSFNSSILLVFSDIYILRF